LGRKETHIGFWWESHGKETIKKNKIQCVYTIQIDFLETGWVGVDWICLVQERDRWTALMNVVMNLQVP
jgi:hypothetical protein